MIVYLYPFRSRYAGRTFSRHIGMDVRHIAVPENAEPRQIAETVVAQFDEQERAAPEGLIDLLVIVANGGPGYITLSGDADDDERYRIDGQQAERFASGFAPLLKPKNAHGQGVEIHACAPAAADVDVFTGEVKDENVGLDFLHRLANAFGHQVKASADARLRGIDEDYEDSLVEANPGEDGDPEGEVRVRRDVGLALGTGTSSRVESMTGGGALLSGVEADR